MSHKTELERFGVKWQGPRLPICVPMADGYWTPWHEAQQRIRELRTALSELAYWARDIAGDCADPIQSQQEDEMMERINKILEKDDA